MTHDIETALKKAFATLEWNGGKPETISGAGSTMGYTAQLRRKLPPLLKKYGVVSLLDAPCGDFNWMKETHLPGINIIGMDIAETTIVRNQLRYGDKSRRFLVGDITRSQLPLADIMLCRDCLIHLPNRFVFQFLQNFARSQISLLLVSNYHNKENQDIAEPGDFRFVNLCEAPFNFPEPIESIEDWTDGSPKRHMSLWTAGHVKRVLAEAGRKDLVDRNSGPTSPLISRLVRLSTPTSLAFTTQLREQGAAPSVKKQAAIDVLSAINQLPPERQPIVTHELIAALASDVDEAASLGIADAAVHSLFSNPGAWEQVGPTWRPSAWALERVAEAQTNASTYISNLYLDSISHYLAENTSAAFHGFSTLRPFVKENHASLHWNLFGPLTVNESLFDIVCPYPSGSATYLDELKVRVIKDPKLGRPSTLLVTFADRKYFERFFPDYIRTLQETQSACRVHLHLMLQDEDELKELEISPCFVEADAVSYSASFTPKTVCDRRSYYASVRFILASALLDRYNTPLFITDVDSLFTENLDEFFDYLSGYDVGLNFNPTYPRFYPWRSIAAGEIYIGATGWARHFCRLLRAFIISHFDLSAHSNWWIDQNALTWTSRHCRAFFPEVRQCSLRYLPKRTGIVIAPH